MGNQGGARAHLRSSVNNYTFSPELLGRSPRSRLSLSMEDLDCTLSMNPRRRLRLSPEASDPHPEETTTPADTPQDSPSGSWGSPDSSSGSCSWSATALSFPKLQGPAGPPSSFRCPETSPDRRQEVRVVPEKSQQDELRSPGFAASSLALAPLPRVDDEILIEDVWRPFCLPVEAGKHQDLCYVSSDTVAALLRGGYAQSVEEFVVVDCRYPYEYAGGHIKGALNLYREDQLVERFLQGPRCPPEGPKSRVFIFHCEFSSERGPRLCRALRELDRRINQYPRLCYPELYLLRGGYRDFH
uniref:M-phase inducer phosphatase n=1 Tax=Ornithorhynchus anatinus TaxID=9258 RepID=A0A6I8P431_ORNAN